MVDSERLYAYPLFLSCPAGQCGSRIREPWQGLEALEAPTGPLNPQLSKQSGDLC